MCADGYAVGVFCLLKSFKITWRCFCIAKDFAVNEEIRDKEVRLIGPNGEQVGVMSSRDAMKIAADNNLDLVKISPNANPPVCKVIDYGKFCFEQAKRSKEAKKNQHVVELKEVRLSLNIDIHDFNTRVNSAIRFFQNGDKVKASIRFRGREMVHPEIGLEVMRRFAEALSEYANVEKPAKLEGRQMLMFLTGKPAKPANKEEAE